MIVLDTSAVIDFAKGDSKLIDLVESSEKEGQRIGVASVTLFELLTPTYHKSMPKKEKILRGFLHEAAILPLDSESAGESAKIMGSLLRIGRPVNVLDALIAGTALAYNADALIARDADFKEIAKVSNLVITMT